MDETSQNSFGITCSLFPLLYSDTLLSNIFAQTYGINITNPLHLSRLFQIRIYTTVIIYTTIYKSYSFHREYMIESKIILNLNMHRLNFYSKYTNLYIYLLSGDVLCFISITRISSCCDFRLQLCIAFLQKIGYYIMRFCE